MEADGWQRMPGIPSVPIALGEVEEEGPCVRTDNRYAVLDEDMEVEDPVKNAPSLYHRGLGSAIGDRPMCPLRAVARREVA